MLSELAQTCWNSQSLIPARQLRQIARDSRFAFEHNAIRFDSAYRDVLYSFPSMVLKSSASAIDADSGAKIGSGSVLSHYFTRAGLCLFCSAHANDKWDMARRNEAGDNVCRALVLY